MKLALLRAGGALMGAGVLTYQAEDYGHGHRHVALDHEHVHPQGDGHHLHSHDPMLAGPHSHPRLH